jgi:hypothetical protein
MGVVISRVVCCTYQVFKVIQTVNPVHDPLIIAEQLVSLTKIRGGIKPTTPVERWDWFEEESVKLCDFRTLI